jgi:tetratricopeptide (TPR) repeat protein
LPRKKSTHVDDARAVGERLREARVRAGLSQRQLAFPGCTAAYISRIEAGGRIPSLHLLRELGARLGVSDTYLATGAESPSRPLAEADMALRFDQPEAAAKLFREVLDSATDPQSCSQALEGLGQVAIRSGESAEAVALFNEALGLTAEEPQVRPALAESLARALASLGDLAGAIDVLEACVQALEDDPLQFVRFSALLGFALTDNANFAEAERVVAQALRRGEGLEDPYARARLYWSDFRLQAEEGQTERAEASARKALEILSTTEDEHALALTHQALAHICIDLDRPDEALEQLTEGWPLMARAGTPIEIAQYRLEEARALSRLGEHERAIGLATEISNALGETHRVDLGRTYVLLAEIWEAVGETARASELYELAIEILETRAPTRYLVRAYKQQANLLKTMGRRDEALDLLERALGIQARTGRPLA